jgi:hypothetical protein
MKVTGLTELTEDLEYARDHVLEETRKVVKRGANNIKKDAKERWSNLAHAPALPRAISYDVTVSGSTISAEIGPDKEKRQGALGNLLEYGSVNNVARPALGPALDAEEPRFLKALEDMAAGLLEGDKSAAEPSSD